MTKQVIKKSGSKVSEKICSFRAINDMAIVAEDSMTPEVDDATGLTAEVVNSISAGKLYIPEIAEYALEKYPCRGLIVSAGHLCKHVKVGDRVIFARLGGQRMLENGKSYVAIREVDILAVLS